MIQHLSIKNFKSIKQVDFPCKKLNVIIGEPNSGKSNLIEALSLKTQNIFQNNIRQHNYYLSHEIFRYKNISDLFFDFNINVPIEIKTDNILTKFEYAFRNNITPENEFHLYLDYGAENKNEIKIGHDGRIGNHNSNGKTNILLYEFKKVDSFENAYQPNLTVPNGQNIPGLLLANPELKKWVSDFLQSKDLRLTIKPAENDIAVSKVTGDEIYSYPYFSISETLMRVIFYTLAIKSNNNATILFDEPESNTFPFYTKAIAEMIALDKTNQFFITTHNPYLLLSLIEKTPKEEINVCIAQMKDSETMLTVLNDEQVTMVLDFDSDVFFNFNSILD